MSEIEIVTLNTDKVVSIYNINGTLFNSTTSNTIVDMINQSYIIQLSNPVTSSYTDIIGYSQTFLGNFLLFVYAILLVLLFYAFVNIVKKQWK